MHYLGLQFTIVFVDLVDIKTVLLKFMKHSMKQIDGNYLNEAECFMLFGMGNRNKSQTFYRLYSN